MSKVYWGGNPPEPRKFFNSVILPACSRYKPILFTGIAGFTKDYKKIVGDNFITVDILPKRDDVIPDICCDITTPLLVDKCNTKFDCVIFNGMLGYGINNKNQVDSTLHNFSKIMSDGALIFTGYDENVFKNRKMYLDALKTHGFEVSMVVNIPPWNVGGRISVIIVGYYKNIGNTIEIDIKNAIKNKYKIIYE